MEAFANQHGAGPCIDRDKSHLNSNLPIRQGLYWLLYDVKAIRGCCRFRSLAEYHFRIHILVHRSALLFSSLFRSVSAILLSSA